MSGLRLLLLGVVALIAAACATAEPERVATTTQPAPKPPAPPRQALAAPYNDRAQALESDGRLREALQARQIALTINPDDAAARAAAAALQAKIEEHVAAQLKEGRAATQRGAQVVARRHYLAVLALDPNNRAAFDALREQTQEVDGIPHTVKARETLAGLASEYYGNRALADVIAETNKLQPNARLNPGMVLKIPEVPGVTLNRPGARPPAPRAPLPTAPGAPTAAAPPAPAPPPLPREEPAEVNPLLAEAREAADRLDYGQALNDIDQLLASSPRNTDALTLKKQVLYSQGKQQLDQRKYRDSYATLNQLSKIAPNYEDSATLMRQTRTRLIDEYYNSGIRYYREEKLPEAIAQWKAVLEIDPQHVNARKNLDQAERLLKQLDERRK
ncbi:MAG TPA: LysM peptidoglycan-binding domain-containing protein [Methylomirabilota bacterium]